MVKTLKNILLIAIYLVIYADRPSDHLRLEMVFRMFNDLFNSNFIFSLGSDFTI